MEGLLKEETVVAENKRINEKRGSLQSRKAELENQIYTSHEDIVSLPKLESFVQIIREKITNQDFNTKRLALDMPNIKVWVDGQNIKVTELHQYKVKLSQPVEVLHYKKV